jgi:hypothetical protein
MLSGESVSNGVTWVIRGVVNDVTVVVPDS